MASVNQISGDDAANTLQGTSGADLIYGFDPNGSTGSVSSISAVRVATGLSQPVAAVSAPGDSNHLFIVERTGAIQVLDLGTGARSTLLDVSSTITTEGEGGLLGLAFDPGYAQNGLFYVNVTNTSDDTEIRRYQVSSGNPPVADPASRLDIITVDQPAGRTNHKGGWLGFGPDGHLYIPTGDGGGGGDPDGNAQNPLSLLGKILRLDVGADAFPGDAGRNYTIPSDNPFVGTAGVAPEIWALGLRNPFRAGFDRDLGTLFIGDVGQASFEEIDIGAAGANYGWDAFEGTVSFEGGPLGPGTLTAPIHSYGRSVGATVIGGFVYRGESDGLQGDYFFADFNDGKVFTLRQQGASWLATDRTAQIVPDVGAIGNPTSFGEDAFGNLYLVDIVTGDVFRLTPNTTSADAGDMLDGEAGDDTIHAGAGDDSVLGGDGDDVLYGGTGGDHLVGGAGADFLIGGAGADLLNGGSDSDTLDGGAGRDVVAFSSTRAQTVLVDNHDGTWSAAGPDGTDTLLDVELVRFTDGDRFLSPSRGDLNGDNSSDLTFQHSDGTVFAWEQGAGGTIAAAPLGTPDPSWQAKFLADFSGDGKADIVFQNSGSGEVFIWNQDGFGITSAGSIGVPGTVWQVRGAGDLNGDGHADIVFQNSATGDVYGWLQNGLATISNGTIGTPGTAWQVEGVADFNGDGRDDLLFQNSGSGEVFIWNQDGLAITAGSSIGTPGTVWQIKGTGDFNGDARADIVFQHSGSGEVFIWAQDGATTILAGAVGTPGTVWQVAGTGDFNADGKTDLAFQNSSSGEIFEWQLDGTQITAAFSLGEPGTAWHIV